MLEILHGIACPDIGVSSIQTSTTTKKYLKAKSEAMSRGRAGTGTDMNALKEKLLLHVGPRAIPEQGKGPATPSGFSRPGPFSHRTYMTNDFVLNDTENDRQEDRNGPGFNHRRKQIGSLACVPVASQESALVRDLLFCFVGIGGMHIKPALASDTPATNSKSCAIKFELDENIDPTLRALVFRITPLCQNYSTVVKFIERQSQMGAGRVNQALAGAMSQVMKDYYIFVAELETEQRKGELTLNKIWFSIQTKLETMGLMADICNTIDRCGSGIVGSSSRGGKTLSLLHEMTVERSASGSDKIRDLGLFLTRKAAEPWFKTLSRWVHRGNIDDPGKDFFVEDNEVIERSALPLEYSDDYWERRYTIKSDQIPAFLHSNADKILRTGKYLNVIQQCGDEKSSTDVKRLKGNFSGRLDSQKNQTNKVYAFDDHFEERHGFTSAGVGKSGISCFKSPDEHDNILPTSDKDQQIEDLCYTENTEEYNAPLERAYIIASRNLLDLLVKDRDLIGHLKSVKHYFLLDQGDFVVQFFDVCGDELNQNVDAVEPTRLESLLELALRTSVANSDPYKDNVRVELLPYDLIYQMSKILSIDTESESDFKGPVNTSELSGLEAFAFGYDVQWPISLILNRKSLACYQMLLRHLFYCKHVEKLITNVWLTTKVTKNLPIASLRTYGPSFHLRQKMLNFLQNLEYYMTFEVLEPNGEDMIAKIRSGKVSNVDQVLKIHSDFLTTCLNDCLLSNPTLLTTVKKLLGVCCEFSEFMQVRNL
jgi:gamma-tubulin complex component 2